MKQAIINTLVADKRKTRGLTQNAGAMKVMDFVTHQHKLNGSDMAKKSYRESEKISMGNR